PRAGPDQAPSVPGAADRRGGVPGRRRGDRRAVRDRGRDTGGGDPVGAGARPAARGGATGGGAGVPPGGPRPRPAHGAPGAAVMSVPVWCADLAARFWATAGDPPPFPRDLRYPITSFPMGVIDL